MFAQAQPHRHQRLYTHAQGCRQGTPSQASPRRALSLTFVSTQIAARAAGGGAVPFRLRDTAPLPAPWGSLSDARGYFKPGSMDDFW